MYNADSSTVDPFFHRFGYEVGKDALPEKFTFPFNYDPHPLAIKASEIIKEKYLLSNLFNYEFGMNVDDIEDRGMGKMFGVLVVESQAGELGFLAAFSGKVGDRNKWPGFVPPVFDILELDGFFKVGEKEINKINQKILDLEAAAEFLENIDALDIARKNSIKEIDIYRQEIKDNKELRKQKRTLILSIEKDKVDHQSYLDLYNNESIKENYILKDLRKLWKDKITQLELDLQVKMDEIDRLKILRKKKSAILQGKIFDSFKFLNQAGEWKDLNDIFKITEEVIPPSGAGECAAPKLFQYAFLHKYKPITMAEFWWGKSPSSEVRKHEHYYPSCKGRCEPILGHMLKGIELDKDPVFDIKQNLFLDILYEDEVILAICKPHDALSVPGKKVEESMYQKLKELLPDATGPLNVHRLDMATSGVMLIAKSMEAYHFLQNQFIKRYIKKTYVAILDGIIAQDEGFIDLPLRVDLDDRPRQLVCYEHGKPAQTEYKVLDRKENVTRIQFHPITGRTHQLRVHASHSLGLNCPIKGDDLYGKKGGRLYLHAESITFRHPLTKTIMTITSPAPF